MSQSKKTSKQNLKTLRAASAKHPLRRESRILKYGASGFVRNFWLSTAATVVMSITLIILFITVVASIILNNTAELMREKIDITIYLKPGLSEQVLEDLTTEIKTDQNVKSVETSTSAEEYEKFLAEYADEDEILNALDDEEMQNIMLSKMQSTMRLKVYNVDDLSSIKTLVETSELFAENLDSEKSPTYDVNQVEIQTITTWANIARSGGIILGAVFLVISILIIFSTIRMAIFSRREEIYMMNLVGADKSFVRGPFLVEAELCGLIAGLLAATVSYFGFTFLAPQLSGYGIDVTAIVAVLESNQLIFVFLAFIVLGMFVGRLSARLAVAKYIRKT